MQVQQPLSWSDIDDYFKEYIFGFVYGDIERCILAKANYVVALALLSYTEYLGALKTGTLGASGTSESNFQEGVKLFEFNGDKTYYRSFKVVLTQNGQVTEANIYKLFRCGVVHEYFPKGYGQVFIHNNQDRADNWVPEDKGIGWISDCGKELLRFHTNAYFRDFRGAANGFYQMLQSESAKKQRPLQIRFSRAIDRIKGRSLEKIT